jgi:hypothetical protein
MLWGQLGYVWKTHYITMDSVTKEGGQVKSQKNKSKHEKWKGGIAFLKTGLLSNKKLPRKNSKTN